MSVPTFNGFSLNDSNFITERITFKSYADRAVIRANVSRREGVKLLGNEFGEKQITMEGVVVAASASALQTLLDSMKTYFTAQEADLIIESGRTFKATVSDLVIPDEHYNQSKAPFQVTFVCTDPFSEGSLLTAIAPLTSGVYVFSGSINISGSLFGRPTIVITPTGAASGNTNINSLVLYHVPTGQQITISGFGNAAGLSYANAVTINFDNFTALEGVSDINTSGAFPRWDPGTNQYTITVSGRWTGGNVSVAYKPRYL